MTDHARNVLFLYTVNSAHSNLPVGSLDRLSLQKKLGEIGTLQTGS